MAGRKQREDVSSVTAPQVVEFLVTADAGMLELIQSVVGERRVARAAMREVLGARLAKARRAKGKGGNQAATGTPVTEPPAQFAEVAETPAANTANIAEVAADPTVRRPGRPRRAVQDIQLAQTAVAVAE